MLSAPPEIAKYSLLSRPPLAGNMAAAQNVYNSFFEPVRNMC